MYCIRCGGEIQTKSKKFCSPRCSQLYHKKVYRTRHHKEIQAYQREWKKRGVRGSPATNGILREHLLRNPACAKCGTTINLHVCHVKPRAMGGRNLENLITLCQKHHHQFDELLRSFWQGEVEVETSPRVTMITEVAND